VSDDPVERGREVIAACLELGFARAGIAPAAPTQREQEFLAWLAAGKHGDMAYLEQYLRERPRPCCRERLDPRVLVPGARSVIMVADRYAVRGEEPPAESDPDRPRGRIARYVRGRDYHWQIKKRLHRLADSLRPRYPGHKFRTVVDSAPVLEREHAARAGLGWIGKHTLLIDPRLGSYLLLGGIITTLDLTAPPEQAAVADHCGTCTRCIDACPTGAITPYSVDASRCISYLTIEHRGPIDPALHAGMGRWIFGCDVCQEVCPHNSARPGAPDRLGEAYRPMRDSFDLLEVLGWTDEDRRAAFTSSAMKRAKLAMMKRNALIAAGNVLAEREVPGLRERIAALAADVSEEPLVRETASQVLTRLAAARGPASGGPQGGPGAR
jgi:epoxyqueuosine reductase